jgi:RNA polymerase sigma-70 factor (ECF subfamily)
MTTVQPFGLHDYIFDAEYLNKLKERDVAIENHFFSYFTSRLKAKLRGRLSPSELIDDVIQETFFRVFVAIHSEQGIRKPQCLGAFVHSVCNHVLLEFYRAKRPHCALEDIPIEPSDKTATAEQMLVGEAAHALVLKTFSRLSRHDQEILQAVFIEERDRKEMCRKLRIRRASLRVRVHRARRQFLKLHARLR